MIGSYQRRMLLLQLLLLSAFCISMMRKEREAANEVELMIDVLMNASLDRSILQSSL